MQGNRLVFGKNRKNSVLGIYSWWKIKMTPFSLPEKRRFSWKKWKIPNFLRDKEKIHTLNEPNKVKTAQNKSEKIKNTQTTTTFFFFFFLIQGTRKSTSLVSSTTIEVHNTGIRQRSHLFSVESKKTKWKINRAKKGRHTVFRTQGNSKLKALGIKTTQRSNHREGKTNRSPQHRN